jgi:hypothetical protein
MSKQWMKMIIRRIVTLMTGCGRRCAGARAMKNAAAEARVAMIARKKFFIYRK